MWTEGLANTQEGEHPYEKLSGYSTAHELHRLEPLIELAFFWKARDVSAFWSRREKRNEHRRTVIRRLYEGLKGTATIEGTQYDIYLSKAETYIHPMQDTQAPDIKSVVTLTNTHLDILLIDTEEEDYEDAQYFGFKQSKNEGVIYECHEHKAKPYFDQIRKLREHDTLYDKLSPIRATELDILKRREKMQSQAKPLIVSKRLEQAQKILYGTPRIELNQDSDSKSYFLNKHAREVPSDHTFN